MYTSTGHVAWKTPLVQGTDLMWGTPPVSDGETIFMSTLSHPGSAAENVAHLVDLTDGAIRWTAGLGGNQGYSFIPAVIDGPVRPHGALRGAERRPRRWQSSLGPPGAGAVVVGERLWVWAGDGSLAVLDPGTGDVIREI